MDNTAITATAQPAECRFCALLKVVKDPVKGEEGHFRCSAGRFDEPSPSGKMIPRSFAWSGIWRPSLFAVAVQKNCPEFELRPHVERQDAGFYYETRQIGKRRPPREAKGEQHD